VPEPGSRKVKTPAASRCDPGIADKACADRGWTELFARFDRTLK
jgi:hypothetical protein